MNIQSDLTIPFQIPKSKWCLNPFDSLFLIGSCFSENMYQRLKNRKFDVYSNPFGILFETLAVETCIREIIEKKIYTENDLFLHNELYSSWNHHSKFSDINAQRTLNLINNEIVVAHNFLCKTKNIVITLGSSFSYYHINEKKPVANCHKVSQSVFEKKLISIDIIKEKLNEIISLVKNLNPEINIIFTISPVRHLRDGVIENNRSKSRLIEAVHDIISLNKNTHYFPAYEIMIDFLRDYRYYDIDYVHPNTLATNIVFDYFLNWCFPSEERGLLEKLNALYLAKNHKPIHPNTLAHKKFIDSNIKTINDLKHRFPSVDFNEELNFFEKTTSTDYNY